MRITESQLRRIVIEEMSNPPRRLPPMSPAQKENSLWKAIKSRLRNGNRDDVFRELDDFLDSIDPDLPWEEQFGG
jgi:hypothetical protein